MTKTWSYRFDRDNVDGMGQALRMVRSLMGEGQIEISEGLKSALDAAELRLVNVAYEGEVLDASFEKDSFHPAAAISSSPRVASENASESFDEAIAKDSFHPAAAISSSPEIVSEPRSSGMKIRPNVQTSKVQEEDFSYSGQLHADRQEELNRISAVETSVPTVKQNKAHPLFQRARKD